MRVAAHAVEHRLQRRRRRDLGCQLGHFGVAQCLLVVAREHGRLGEPRLHLENERRGVDLAERGEGGR